MSTAAGVIAELTAKGVELWGTPGGKLRYAPKDALSSEEVVKLKEHKSEILRTLGDLNLKNATTQTTFEYKNTCKTSENDRCSLSETNYTPTPRNYTTPDFTREAAERASALGLVARWPSQFGYISIHDPLDGLWHDLPTKDAPAWAKREARKRKDLKKKGESRTLTCAEMEELWEGEQAPMWDSPYRPEDAKEGLVYDAEQEEGKD